MRRLIAVAAVAMLASGCAGDRLQYTAAGNASASPLAPETAASSTAAPASEAPVASPAAPGRTPATNRTTAPPPQTNVARQCRMADLRFWLSLSLPMHSPTASASVQMTNTASDRCRVSGYITVRWLDSGGNQMPITVEKISGTMPAYTSVLQPGKSAHAGLRWVRSRSLPSDPDILCPPAPASIEARLSTETTFARMAWTPGHGLCDSKAGLQPIEMTP